MTSTSNSSAPSLIGSVFERKPSIPKPPSSSSQSRFTSTLNSKTGFPLVQHRSQKSSAFLKNIENSRRKPELSSERSTQVPSIVPQLATPGPGPSTVQSQNQEQNGVGSTDDWRSHVSAENEARVQAMTEEERAAETREILERFGPSVSEILRRARENREKNKDVKFTSLEEVPFTSEREPLPSPIGLPGSQLLSSLSRSSSRASTRPSSPNSPSRASRKLRFAELGPDQVHVYPSAPSSPKKTLLALPPPDEDSNAVSLGIFKGRMKPIDLEDATASQTQVEQVKEEAAKTHEEGTAEIQVEQVEEGTTEIQVAQIEKGTAETQVEQVEEGTAEYIRQKYFPSAPADNPDLAWMSSSLDPSPPEKTPDLRFDLNGTPIPSSKILSLPTHLGLHHHAEGTRAGYTLDDIFLLTRSTVRAQRAAMLEVLVGVTRWLRTSGTKDEVDIEAARKSLLDLPNPEGSKIPPLLKRILFAGLEALPERGAVGVRAMDVVWECVVGQTNVTEDLGDLEFEFGGMEEGKTDEGVLITALPLADVLPQFLSLLLSPPDSDLGDERLSASTLDQPESQSLRITPAQQQILSILTRLARYSNTYAETIVQEKGLIEGLLRVFIIPPATSTYASTPNLSTIRLLTILASASRTNAEALCQKIGAGDVLLRFVVLSTNDNVLVEIMIFYTILARYGMYSRVAADAKEVWWKIGDHVVALSSSYSQSNMRLVRAYVGLIEAWLICATDPHRTTPSHELLWSQVKSWEWGAGLASLLTKCSRLAVERMDTGENSIRIDVSTSASLWRSLGVYLEGAKVNGIRGGEEERTEVGLVLKRVFDSGAVQTFRNLIEDLKTKLNTMGMEMKTTVAFREIASLASILSSAIRLWLGCCPPSPSDGSLPFELPFADISDLCALLVRHDLWHLNLHPLLIRPLSTLLVLFLRLSPHLPGSHPDLWLAQAFGVIKTLRRGDEEYALQIISQILDMLTLEWAAQRGGVGAPDFVWKEKGGLKAVLIPFLRYEINPEREPYTYVAPLFPSSRSIGMCTTLRIPSSYPRDVITHWRPLGLPLHSDWTLSPFNHLLRSGSDYSVFKQSGALPDSWDASEIDVVRAALALTMVEREVLRRFAPSMISLVGPKEEDIVFACMKVFMLEHDVGNGDSQTHSDGEGLQEVFRDEVVARQLHEILEPYTVKALSSSSTLYVPSSRSSSAPLELASLPLLGTSVPFYQFYTDFLSLYDSISFSHPLFSRLILPPTSMRYAADYRKLLWNDYSHVLRGIRVEVDDVIAGAGGIEQWLYPVETAPDVLGAYLRALIKYGEGLQGFLRLLAVHHVAANIWPDFYVDTHIEELVFDERRSKLLRVVIEQGGMEVVKDVLRYRQSPQLRRILCSPACFQEVDESCKRLRCDLIANWIGEGTLKRVRGVFERQ